LRSALLDGLAHDLKTPLTAIKTSASALMNREGQMDPTGRELLEIIDEEVETLQNAVGEAIEAARIESGNFQLRSARVNVSDLIRGVIAQRHTYATRVRFQGPAHLLVAADTDLMRLALRQLIDNAVRYSPDSKPVLVDVTTEGSGVAIEVRDYGGGITSAEQSRVFDKYYQGSAGKLVAGGSGLGLAVAKRVVEAHGGTITLESSEQGSAFTIRLKTEQT
jgi:two-component system sensor histidine kinase KdpD